MTSPAKIKVFVVDDHPVVREGLRAVLELRADCEVVGEAADGRAAIEGYERLRPDVIIVDIRLPVVGGIEAIGAIRQLDPEARIIAITSYGGDAEIRRALDAGARGLLLKGASGAEVVDAVRRVYSGRTYIAADATDELRAGSDSPNLTRRESEVLTLMADGLRNHQIAQTLGLSVGTVKVHVNRILEKLDAVDRTEAVTRALRRGLITLQ
jgi:two-component system NarL family response regulator